MSQFKLLRDKLVECLDETVLLTKIESVIERKPPKLVAIAEMIRPRDHGKLHRTLCQQMRDKIPAWAEQFGIARELWKVWNVSLPITKIGSKIPVNIVASPHELDELESEQAVRILESKRAGDGYVSRILMDYDNSIMKQMADSVFYGIRLYVCIRERDANAAELRRNIEAQVRKDLPDFPYNP